MKKLLLAAAVASLSVTAAQAAPTVYGKINLSLDSIDNPDFAATGSSKAGSRGEVNSNSSRIGVKGEEKLTDNMSAVYQMEWQVNVDGNNALKDGSGKSISNSDLTQRNRFIGLKFNNIGTIKAGKYDSYFKTAAGDNQDIFNDHNWLDMTNVLHGEERLSNVVGFESDKNLLGGVQFNIMSAQGESTSGDLTNTSSDTKIRNNFGSGISTSVLYDNKKLGLALGAAYNSGIAGKFQGYDISGVTAAADAFRFTASYDFSTIGFKGFTLGGLWQTAELSNPSKAATNFALKSLQEDAYTITAAYAIPSTKWTVKAEYVNANTTYNDSATTKQDRTIEQYGLGVDYALNKQAKLYGVAAQQNRDWLSSKIDTRTVYGLGMIYNF